MPERLFNVGYVGFAVEVTPGVALTPTDFGQAYDFGMTTNRNLEKLAPAAGNVFGTQNVVPGLRDHMGDTTLVFEPNTAEKLVAMMLTAGSRTGGGPYIQPFTLTSNNPSGSTYTIEVSDGNTAQRYFGCQVEKLTPAFSGNEVQIKPTISAVGSFQGREVASVAGTSPYVITLLTDYDPAPATGIVIGDIMQAYEVSGGTTINFTVSAVTATSISTTTNVAALSSGDSVRLRALTPSFTMLSPILWSNTQFCFGADATAALAAAQTRVESGSTWEYSYPFKDNKGEHRSGGQDPATLLRKPADGTLTIKKYFDTPQDVINYNNLNKSACVVRHFVYTTGEGGPTTYEFRITFHNLTTNDPTPKFKAGDINYSEIKYLAKQDTSDNAAVDIIVKSSNATLT